MDADTKPGEGQAGTSHAHTIPVQQIPALGMSVIGNIGGDRQITLQAFIDRDAPEAETNALADRMMRVMNRQKAIGELPTLKGEIKVHKQALERMLEDQNTVEHAHRMNQAKRRAELKELQRGLESAEKDANRDYDRKHRALTKELEDFTATRKQTFETGYKAFVDSGREGEYEPAGHAKTNLDRYDAAIVDLNARVKESAENRDRVIGVETAPYAKLVGDKEAEIQKAEAERTAHAEQLEVSKRRYTEEIVAREEKIVANELIIKGEPAAGEG